MIFFSTRPGCLCFWGSRLAPAGHVAASVYGYVWIGAFVPFNPAMLLRCRVHVLTLAYALVVTCKAGLVSFFFSISVCVVHIYHRRTCRSWRCVRPSSSHLCVGFFLHVGGTIVGVCVTHRTSSRPFTSWHLWWKGLGLSSRRRSLKVAFCGVNLCVLTYW